MRYKAIPKYELSDIDEVFLLSVEEWGRERTLETVPKYTGWWWQRSPGCGGLVHCTRLYCEKCGQKLEWHGKYEEMMKKLGIALKGDDDV